MDANRRAAIGRALNAREPLSTDGAFLVLTEDERANGLAIFGGEEGNAREDGETFTRVPAQIVDTVFPTDRTFGEPRPTGLPEPLRTPRWETPLLAGMLTLAVVVFAAMSLHMIDRTLPARLATPGRGTAERPVPAREAVESTAVTPIPPAPATVPPPRRAPPAPLEPEPRPVRREPPRQAASLLTSGEPEPLPEPEPEIMPHTDSPALPASVAVAPGTVASVPVPGPRLLPVDSNVAPGRPPAPETAIQTQLSRYRTAYQDLDASAARAVWPGVDHKALRKAFGRLEQQELVFDYCQIAVSDARAVASCRGSASYVPRVGNKARRDEQRQWDFTLSRVDDVWLIDTVSAR